MTFVPRLGRLARRFWDLFGRVPPGEPRPRRPVVRLLVSQLEDRTLPSAVAASLLPRPTGGPLDSALRQALFSPRGPGYPVGPGTATAFAGDLGRAAQPVSTLLSPASGQAGGALSLALTPLFSTGTPGTAPLVNDATGLGAVRASAFPSAFIPGQAAVGAPPAQGAAVPKLGAVVEMQPTAKPFLGAALTQQALFGDIAEPARLAAQVAPLDAVWGWMPTKVASPAPVESVPPAAAQEGRLPPPPAAADVGGRAEDLAALLPLEQLLAGGIVPGTPNLATGLSVLDPAETSGPHGSTVGTLVFGALFTVGSLGLGRFRDSFAPAATPEKPPKLRVHEEEDEE
jgi:hypothetical protein